MNVTPKTRAFKGYLSLLLLCLSLLLASCSKSGPAQRGQGQGQGRGNMVMPVGVAAVERRDMPIYLTGLGTVTAFNTVNVKSRLDGQLLQVAFREGQDVKQGQLLAVVDPRPYEVALSQAKANLFRDQAQLKDARVNLDRFQDLFKAGVIARQQLDTQSAQAGQLEGAVQADQAQIDSAKLNLVYTRITAPVSGRVGLRQVDVGNMVHASDQTPMLVITQVTPIAVLFTLPQDSLPAVAARMRQGTLQVDAYSRDAQTKIASGKLLTIDNQIDLTTGTGRLKAVFDNADHALWPNQFVNVQLLLETRQNSLVVPAAAVQRGPQGTYVYVVKADKTVENRPVEVAFTQNNQTSLKSGLEPGEIVVTDGQDKLLAGKTQVEIRSGPGAGASASAGDPPQADSGRGAGNGSGRQHRRGPQAADTGAR